MSKPKVLILGGCGFIGRNLVKYLVEQDCTSYIRVADKTPPSLSDLNPELEELFNTKVDFVQCRIGNPGHMERAFNSDKGEFDLVVHLAAETKYGQEDEVYRQLVTDVAVAVGQECGRRGISKFIYLSTAQIYKPGKKCSDEEGKLEPWTGIAKASLAAEEAIKETPGCQWIILRPGFVYGPADKYGISPRCIMAAVYKQIGEKMKFLWNKDLRINTVHVRDVARAIWHCYEHAPPGSTFNLIDKGDTSQKTVADLLSKIFNIKVGFYGNIKSGLAKMVGFKDICEEANDRHMGPWSELEKEFGLRTPLSPFLDMELLYNQSLAADGRQIELATGFEYAYPKMTEELLREQIQYWIDINAFPPVL